MKKISLSLILILAVAALLPAQGTDKTFNYNPDYAQVIYVNAVKTPDGLWRFDVTVRHYDEGWSHYAVSWEVVNPETMEVISERILAHPHVDEQPFTRSQGGIKIPGSIREVLVRAKCQRHGFGGQEITVPLVPGESSLFKVEIR